MMDGMGHVNNAITWAAIEDECDRRGIAPTCVTAEWSGSLEKDDDVRLRAAPLEGGLGVWLVVDSSARASAIVS